MRSYDLIRRTQAIWMHRTTYDRDAIDTSADGVLLRWPKKRRTIELIALRICTFCIPGLVELLKKRHRQRPTYSEE